MKTFAVIEDADELAFFTSFDTPDIRNEVSRWKFVQYDSAEVHTVPGEQEVVVDVGHFCFGILARRKRRSMLRYMHVQCTHHNESIHRSEEFLYGLPSQACCPPANLPCHLCSFLRS